MHLHIYAGIYRYMHASTCRCFFCIYRYMLLHFPRVLKSIYIYMLFQCRTCYFPVSYKPKLLLRVPSAARSFSLLSHRHVFHPDSQRHERVCSVAWFRWFPCCSLDDEFDCFDPLLQFIVVFEANAQQSLAVLVHEAFRSPLPRFEN